jgi:hypothetical protein
MSDRVTATKAGGVGAIHALVRRLGLPQAIDERLHPMKRHQPYHESDHVLALANNALAGGTRLQDLVVLRRRRAIDLDSGKEGEPRNVSPAVLEPRLEDVRAVLADVDRGGSGHCGLLRDPVDDRRHTS